MRERPEDIPVTASVRKQSGQIERHRDTAADIQQKRSDTRILGLRAYEKISAGHPLDLERLEPPAFLDAVIASFHGREASLAAQIFGLIA